MKKVREQSAVGNGGAGSVQARRARPAAFLLGLPLQPAYEFNPNDPVIADALDRLVGFRIHETERRIEDWLVRHGFHQHGPFDVTRALPSRVSQGEPEELRKARALDKTLERLRNLCSMHGVERLAAQRWSRALLELATSLKRFRSYANIRGGEQGAMVNRSVGRARDGYNQLCDQTQELSKSAEALETLAREAQAAIETYKDDPLPGLEGTKPHLRFLARLEALLSIAGFGPAEIAEIVIDNKRHGHGATAKRQHRERITTRAKQEKPSLSAQAASRAAVDASIEAWKARTGLDGRSMAEYFDSREYRAYQRSAATQTAQDPERGKQGRMSGR